MAHLKLPMPRTTRELFDLFAFYHPSEGLAGLLDRIDFADVKPLQIYQVALGRAPERIDLAVPGQDYSPRKHLTSALLSGEFRKNSLRQLLTAFPEKRRDVFIHIPKCAGTDLILHLGRGRLVLPKMIEFERWVSDEEFFEALRGWAQAIPYYDSFFVYGHMILGEYASRAAVRAGDRIFSVLREPIDIMLSQANYAVTRLRQDPSAKDPDTREFLRSLGIEGLPDPVSVKDLRGVAMQALLHRGVAQPDRISSFLGNPGTPTYAAAIRNIVMHNVELTATEHYAGWLAQRWGITAETHANVSDHWLTRDDLTADVADQLRQRTAEDQKVYDVVCWALEKKGTPSITGAEIAEIVGPGLLEEFPEKLARERPRVIVSASCLRNTAEITVIQGKEAIAAYLRNPSQTEPHFVTGFGQDGGGKAYLRDGWANPEAEFVWTAAPVSRLEIPKPRGAGYYRMRLIARPFVVNDRLPSQRFSIAVNGILLGSGEAIERAVIECDLPDPVLAGSGAVSITMTMPDAARPSEIRESGDRRQLGLALERIEVLRSETAWTGAAPVAAQVGSATAAANGANAAADAPPLPLRDLMMRFESLGQSCEFGLVQRRCEAEPLGLFRFASAPLPKLLAALNADFAGFGEPDALDIELSGGEYMVNDKRFGLLYHAWVRPGEMTPEDVHTREVRRLPLLIRKLREDLSEAEKIFVYHGMGLLGGADALPLAAALRHYGPNTLLWVELADSDHPAGTVEWAGAGLLKGYIDRFAPSENAHDLSLDCWITICQTAWRLQQERVRGKVSSSGTVAELSSPSVTHIAG